MSLVDMNTTLPDGSTIVVLPTKSEDEFYNHDGGTSEEEWHRARHYDGALCNNKELEGIISYYDLGSCSKFYVTKNGFVSALHSWIVYETYEKEDRYQYKYYKNKSCLLVQPVEEDRGLILYIRIL